MSAHVHYEVLFLLPITDVSKTSITKTALLLISAIKIIQHLFKVTNVTCFMTLVTDMLVPLAL